jgi:hypothetical protein
MTAVEEGTATTPRPTRRAMETGTGMETATATRAFVDAYDKDALLELLDGGAGSNPNVADTEWKDSWDNRYPWGFDGADSDKANYLGSDNTTELPVWSKPDGAAEWGHVQMGGSVWEWVFDYHDLGWYAGDGNDCEDCAKVDGDGARTMRGATSSTTRPTCAAPTVSQARPMPTGRARGSAAPETEMDAIAAVPGRRR